MLNFLKERTRPPMAGSTWMSTMKTSAGAMSA